MSHPGSGGGPVDDFARDRNGHILRDAYGRPVPRRPAEPYRRRPRPDGSPRPDAAPRPAEPDLGRHSRRSGGRSVDEILAEYRASSSRGESRGERRGERRAPSRGERPERPERPERSERPSPRRPQPPAEQRPPAPVYRRGPAQPGPAQPGPAQPGPGVPPQGYPQQGMPPRQGMPRQPYPPQGHSQPGYPPQQGYPQQPGYQQPYQQNPYAQRPAPHAGPHHTGPHATPHPAPRPAPHTTPAPKPARPRPRRRLGIRRTLGIILTVLLVLTLGTLAWVDMNLGRTDAIHKYDGRVANTAGTNWLLVGSDSRAGMSPEDADRLMAGELDDSVGRTDTIMIVHIPRFGGRATMLSLPRDSWVTIPGHGEDKLNQAFSIGGPALLQETVEQSTGLRIDRYAEIGFGGFAGVVDAVGGITICVDEPLDDPMAGINLATGCQKMDGPTALGYVRSRYVSANGDLDRVARQQKFLHALAGKLASPGTLLNPFRFFPTIAAVTHALTVDRSDHVWNLAWLGLAMARGVNQETVPVGGFMDTYAGNVVTWDEPAAQELFDSLK